MHPHHPKRRNISHHHRLQAREMRQFLNSGIFSPAMPMSGNNIILLPIPIEVGVDNNLAADDMHVREKGNIPVITQE